MFDNYNLYKIQYSITLTFITSKFMSTEVSCIDASADVACSGVAHVSVPPVDDAEFCRTKEALNKGYAILIQVLCDDSDRKLCLTSLKHAKVDVEAIGGVTHVIMGELINWFNNTVVCVIRNKLKNATSSPISSPSSIKAITELVELVQSIECVKQDGQFRALDADIFMNVIQPKMAAVKDTLATHEFVVLASYLNYVEDVLMLAEQCNKWSV